MTDTDVITVQIDRRTHHIPAAVFRRLLTAARPTLHDLRKKEGRDFPAVDRTVLELIEELQFRHSALI